MVLFVTALLIWSAVMLVVVGLCVSARDGDRDLGYADAPPAQRPPRVSM